ncbi:unnamed protein product [Allacma fusca]|uniref:Protein sleepless n=1 Tax=Allacma fusca TaxID=39272 RepID=A0A8J2PKG7_9HEXA|nr:unnamed protein product [Allacma fusca]
MLLVQSLPLHFCWKMKYGQSNVVLLLLILFVVPSLALRCYYCSGDEDCKGGGGTSKLCPPSGYSDGCLRRTNDEGIVIERDCASGPYLRFNCTTDINGFKTCICKGHLCNGVSNVISVWVTI